VNNSSLSGSVFSGNLYSGDLILIIQMQGATINIANNASYGAVTNYNSAGLYEFRCVSSVPNSTTINFNVPLVNNYSSSGKTQVIRVPRYTSFNLASGNTIRPANWNGRSGGITVIEIGGNGTINGAISDLSSTASSGLSTEISRATSVENSIAASLSSEVSRATAAEGSIATSLSSEVSRAQSAELMLTNIYAKHVDFNESADGVLTSFTLASHVKIGSELIYLNGLFQDTADYTVNITSGKTSGVTFSIAPSSGDKVRAYGVY
jgi:hypothetical protein